MPGWYTVSAPVCCGAFDTGVLLAVKVPLLWSVRGICCWSPAERLPTSQTADSGGFFSADVACLAALSSQLVRTTSDTELTTFIEKEVVIGSRVHEEDFGVITASLNLSASS